MWINALPMTSCVHSVQATLALSHDDMLQDKLNLDAYIIDTLFGPVLKARPNNTVDFLGHFSENVFHLERNSTKSNKLGHVLGAALTSLPIGEGGVNPYNFRALLHHQRWQPPLSRRGEAFAHTSLSHPETSVIYVKIMHFNSDIRGTGDSSTSKCMG